MNPSRIKKLIIAAIALHSLALGVLMLALPGLTLRLSGWDYDGPAFFPAQSGIFLVILGGAYVAALWRPSFVWFLVGSKAAAVVFLVIEYLIGAAPAVALLAALFDGLMGLAVAAAAIWEMRSRTGEIEQTSQT